MCRISSADCFISGFTASQSPQLRLRSIVGYTSTLCSTAVCFASHFSQSFFLRYTLKNTLEKTFSTCIRFHFSASFFLFYSTFLLLRIHERQIISLLILESFNLFAGVFRKNFYSHTIIGKLRAVCRGISQKFLYVFFICIENLILNQKKTQKSR